MMVDRMRAHRERQSMAVHNRHDFLAFSALCGSDIRAATFLADRDRSAILR
jgi:hypothetical protein